MNGGLFWIHWGTILEINLLLHQKSSPKNEGLIWILKNFERGYFGKGGGLFGQRSIVDEKSLTVQMVCINTR